MKNSFLRKYCSKLIVIFILITSIMIGGCKKKKETHYIPSYIKQYSFFQIGSYWIYKNNKTAFIDSCFITNSPNVTFHDLTGMNNEIWETFNIQYNHSLIYESWYMFDQYHIGLHSNFDVIGMSGSSLTLGYTYKVSGLDSKIFTNLFIFDTLILNGTKHFNVLNTKYSEISNTNDTSKYFFYFEKYVGLIKIVHYDRGKDTTWSLIRYHVNY
jgi:hypothetical protein